MEEGKPLPTPSKPERGQRMVELPARYNAKVLLLNEMAAQKIRPVELARRLDVTPQEVTRLLSLRHTSRIDGIASDLRALGKSLEIRVV